jgi:cephalosporin-C deacetylase-like acetyl esterase
MKLRPILSLAVLLAVATAGLAADAPSRDTTRGDQMLADYFRAETAAVASHSLTDIKSLEDWTSRRETYRKQLQEMLGLLPEPARTPLQAKVTGKVDATDFTVEKVQFQSRPGLYVTGDLYLPKGLSQPAPAVLYVCGHGNVKKNGVSYGSKTFYQHWGSWLASNGYVALLIDTLELGEIEGQHHGTFREGMWWWNSRGYTPAGVEAWNGIRAIDYLQSRKEVDKDRIGVTGRSGGGAYSWWIAALDERIKVAVPTAGITDLENHVVDGVIEGHCDCMFPVNTYRWDFPQVAALVAPRPLLIENSDKDPIFPLEGVMRLHAKVRNIYRLYNAGDKLGITITEGPHKDTQELQVPTLHWLNRYLKGEDPAIRNVATKSLQPEDLKVFAALPVDEKNTKIYETFVPAAGEAPMPLTQSRWNGLRDQWIADLREKSFRGWPLEAGALDVKRVYSAQKQGIQLTAYDFNSQAQVPLRLYVVTRAGSERPDSLTVNVLDEEAWTKWLSGMRPGFEEELKRDAGDLPAADDATFLERQNLLRSSNAGFAYLAPRGIGPTAWTQDAKKLPHIRRRFALLGQTVDGMRVWDTRRAVQALRSLKGYGAVPVSLVGQRDMAGIALYASLFEPNIAAVDLYQLPHSHREGPVFLNVLKVLDIPQTLAIVAERTEVHVYQKERTGWEYPAEIAFKLGWDGKQFQVRSLQSPPL